MLSLHTPAPAEAPEERGFARPARPGSPLERSDTTLSPEPQALSPEP